MKISSSIFVVACLLNVGLVLGYQPWAENLDKPEDQWKILKFYPNYLRNTKLNDDGRVINEYDADVTSEYVEIAKPAIERARAFYQTYSPEKAKEESELLYEITEGDEEFKDLWELTTPDPVLYTTPAPGSEPKLAKGITIEDIVQQVLLFDINGKPNPEGFAENPLGITEMPEMKTEPAIETSTTKKVTSEPSFDTTVVKSFVEMTRAPVQLVDDEVKLTVESDAESENSDKPVEALSLHEVLSMNLTGPTDGESDLFKVHEEIEPGNVTSSSVDILVHDDELETGNVTSSSWETKVHDELEPKNVTFHSMEIEVHDAMETDNMTSSSLVNKVHEAGTLNVVHPGTKAYDQYFYNKVEDHEDGNISWQELVATLSLNRSDLVPLIVRNKRQAKDLNAPLTDFYPTSNPKFAGLTRDEIEKEFDLGRITLEEYAKDFVAYIDSTLPASKLDEDVAHGVIDVSSISKTAVDVKESKVFDQDKNLATSVEIINEPTFTSTEIHEPSNVPLETFVVVEEKKHVPHVSSDVTVLKTAGEDLVQEDIDEAYEQGKITFEEYKGHFKNFVENNAPAFKTTENTVVESVAFVEEEEPIKSLDVSSNSKAAVDNMKDSIFEQDKVSDDDHPDSFVAFVENKEEPTFKTTEDFKIESTTFAVVDEEPMPTESVLKAVVDNVSEDIDEGFKQKVKEFQNHFVTSVDKQAPAFKTTKESEFSSVPVETMIVEEEPKKPTDDSTNAKAAIEIAEDEDVDKAFEEGRISIIDYNDHFVNFVQNKFQASKTTDDFEPTIAPLESFSVIEEIKPSDASSPSKAVVKVDDQDVDKAFEEGRISINEYNDHFVNFVQNKFPASKITDDFESTIAPLESSSVVEEELTKSSDAFSPSKAAVGIVEDDDVDKAFEEGRISIIDYNDHFVNFVQNKFPASKTPKENFESFNAHVENESAVVEEEESVPTESSVSSLLKTEVNINTEEDVDKAFEQGKISMKEYADHFVAFVEKNIPALKTTEDAEHPRSFKTEPLSSQSSKSSNHEEPVVGLEEQGIAKELEESKVSPKEFINQLLSMKKSILSSKSTSDSSDVVSSNRGRQNVDAESDLSFVPNKSSNKMSMEEMMSSLGLTKEDLHEILANVQPLWKGNFIPKSRSNSKITRPQKISTTEAPIISTTPVPQRKVPTSVSPPTKVDVASGSDFVKDFMEGKISKSEYINMLIKSSKTPLTKPITKPSPSPKTPKKTVPTSKTSAPRPIHSKKVVQPSAISKPTPVSTYAKNPLFAVLGKNSPPVPFVPTSPTKDLVSPLNTKLATSFTTKPRFNVYGKVPARFGAIVESVFTKYDSPLYAVHKKAPISKAVGRETTPVRKESPLYAVFEKAPTSTHGKSTPSSKAKVSGSAGNPLYAVFEKAPTSTRVKPTSYTKNTKSAHPNPLYAVFEKSPTSNRVKSTSHTKSAHPNPLYAVFEKSPTSTNVKSTSYTKNTKSAYPNPLYAVFERPTSSKKTSSVVKSKPKQTWVTVPEDEFKHLKKAPVSNLLDVVYTGAKPVFRNGAKPVQSKPKAEVSTNQPIVTYSDTNTLPRSFLSILGTDAKKPKYEIHYHNYNVKLPHHVATPFIHKLFHGLHSKTKTEEEDPEKAVREISKVFQRIE